jgi:hypothetical protein
MFFGLSPAQVIEENYQCRGDDACLFRVTEVDEEASRTEYLEMLPNYSRRALCSSRPW